MEGGPRDAQLVQPALGRQLRSFDEADDLQLLGCRIPHSSSPHPRSCVFEQPQFEGLLGHDLLQITGLSAQILDLARRCRPPGASSEPRGVPWTNCNRGSGQCLHGGTDQQCCPRTSGRPARSSIYSYCGINVSKCYKIRHAWPAKLSQTHLTVAVENSKSFRPRTVE